MLLCRRILRAHASNSASAHQLVQGHARDRTFIALRYTHVNLVNRDSPSKTLAQPPTFIPSDPPLDPRSLLLERVSRLSRQPVPKATNDSEPPTNQLVAETTEYDPLDTYAELRAQDPTLSASLPSDVLCCIAMEAIRRGSKDIVDSLTADVLDDHLLHQEKRVKVAASLLCIPLRSPKLLDKHTTLSLFRTIHHLNQLFTLPALATLHVIKTIVYDTTSDTLDRSLMDFILSPFQEHLVSLQPPTGANAVSYRPPQATFLAYMLIDKFVSFKWYHEAFKLFQILSDLGHLPGEAFLSEVPSPLAHDFAVIVKSTLARACLHWGKYHRGVGFIVSIMQSQDSLKEDLGPLALELLHACLEMCSLAQFKACAWLMCRLVDPRLGIIIPTETIHLFYSRAMRLRDRKAAYVFYSHARSIRVRRTTDYPPPHGAALTWLMKYLLEQKRDVHLARCLAKQAVGAPELMPRYDRGSFIALAASQGFATEARALWERYTVKLGRELVVGNAATMIRVVSLFAQRASWARTKLEKADIRARADLYKEMETDYYQFAHQVLEAFRKSILPVEEADHFSLSALARGYFMLGEVGKGLGALRVLIARQELPDRYDINIALSAMAHQSPRAASLLVDRMVEQGLQPDAVTFGTVLHEAVVQGDDELVREIRDRARGAGTSLSPRMMASLIQASLAIGEDVDNGQLKVNVQRAWRIMETTGERSVILTPRVGMCCIVACLHLEDPEMAYKFWTRLVREKTEWWDWKQRMHRDGIASMIRRHCEEGRLATARGEAMLRALGR